MPSAAISRTCHDADACQMSRSAMMANASGMTAVKTQTGIPHAAASPNDRSTRASCPLATKSNELTATASSATNAPDAPRADSGRKRVVDSASNLSDRAANAAPRNEIHIVMCWTMDIEPGQPPPSHSRATSCPTGKTVIAPSTAMQSESSNRCAAASPNVFFIALPIGGVGLAAYINALRLRPRAATSRFHETAPDARGCTPGRRRRKVRGTPTLQFGCC